MVQKLIADWAAARNLATSDESHQPMRAFWLLVAAGIGGVLVWQGRPWLEQRTGPGVEAVPRAIEPRGDLAADEKSTVELFERSKGSVVFITTTQLVRDIRSRNMFSIPPLGVKGVAVLKVERAEKRAA